MNRQDLKEMLEYAEWHFFMQDCIEDVIEIMNCKPINKLGLQQEVMIGMRSGLTIEEASQEWFIGSNDSNNSNESLIE